MQTIRNIVKVALMQNSKYTNRQLRDIVSHFLGRPITYNLSGTMVKQERQRLNTIFLFVYGTLMQGYGNNQWCLKDASFMQKDTIKGLDMYTNGSFPMLVDSDDPEKIVHGELFLINTDTFRQCDGLEGYPRHYNRKQVQTASGKQAWVYFYEKTSFQMRSGLFKIDDGDFRKWDNDRREARRLEIQNQQEDVSVTCHTTIPQWNIVNKQILA